MQIILGRGVGQVALPMLLLVMLVVSWLLGLGPRAALRPEAFVFSSHSPPCTCLTMKEGPLEVCVFSVLELTALLICPFHLPP